MNPIRYDLIVQDAMLSVVRRVLQEVEKTGLPGDHHFYITFATNYPGVVMPDALREKYPDEITVVLQHEFEDLAVTNDSFKVTLWFNGNESCLNIPFYALKAFFDPSVKFGLQFNVVMQPEETADTKTEAAPSTETPDDTEAKGEAKVISLDSFRKK